MWKVQPFFGQVLTKLDKNGYKVGDMYGKIFETLYSGSMVGSGAKMFAVWGYVIAHMRRDAEVGAQVDLNPKLLGFILGESEYDIAGVIETLCSPDASSRTPDEEGRRLVKVGQFTYRVVNGAKYIEIRSAEERREYFRQAKRKERGRKAGGSKPLKGEAEFCRMEENGEDTGLEPGNKIQV